MHRRSFLKGLFAVAAVASMPIKRAAIVVAERFGWQSYTSYFKWNAGNTVKDWRYVTRIANIDHVEP